MFYVLLIPSLLQSACMAVDEFYYHHKRGLPLWERIGHPLDTSVVLMAISVPLLSEFTPDNLFLYIVLSALSCLMITKDERVHVEYCEFGEQWLHSFMFVLHPIVFMCTGFIWYFAKFPSELISITPSMAHSIFVMQSVTVGIFMLYQIIYWNFIWKPKPE